MAELGRKTCGRGEILRNAYTTKKGVHVPSSCVPDKGAPGKGKKTLPKPSAGALRGWNHTLPSDERHTALKSVVSQEGCATAIRNLNLLANFTKRTSPDTHEKARTDMKWLRDQPFCHLKSKMGGVHINPE